MLAILAIILVSSIPIYYVTNQHTTPQQSLAYISVTPTNSVPKILPNILTCLSCIKSVEFSFEVTSTLIKQTTVNIESVLLYNNTNQLVSKFFSNNFQVTFNNTVQKKATKIFENVPADFVIDFNSTTGAWMFGTYNLAVNLNFGSPFSANNTYTLSSDTFTLVNGLPSNIKTFVPIFITNSQTIATIAPFQQMISVNNLVFTSVEAKDLSNVEFFDNNGKILNSWLENGNSNTGKSTYWVLLPNGVPANSTIKIFMGFADLNASLFNGVTIGEASQLSENIGQYNNIGHIMNPGLLMQVYYSKNATTIDSKNYQAQTYLAYMTNGSRLNYALGDFNSTINPIVTPQNGTPYNSYFSLFGYQSGQTASPYSGLASWPSNWVPDPSHSWTIKMVGWADMNQSTTFYITGDDGVAVSMTNYGNSFNGSSWLGGTAPPDNMLNAWHTQGATIYNYLHASGSYRLEINYYEDGGLSAFWLYTTLLINYYHASLPPNNVVPSNTFGTYSQV